MRKFGSLVAVDHVSLEIERGTIFGFVGPNGSGKSTTIRMLCGLLTPTAGTATVLGHALPQDAEKLRRRVGYMTQAFSLYRDLSVAENLDFVGEIYSMPRQQRHQRRDHWMKRLDLERYRHHLAGRLSGGQRQWLALAASLLHQPEVLILDEPTSQVDPQTRRDFWRILFELADDGVTILVSTHFMDEAERCHRLGILDRGCLVTEGPPQTLMHNLPVDVYRVSGGDLRRAEQYLLERNGVHSVVQIGDALRVLIERGTETRSVLDAAPGDLSLEAVTANLEDVFVVATNRPSLEAGSPLT